MSTDSPHGPAPSRLNIKRKASDLPPDALIYPSPKKPTIGDYTPDKNAFVYVLERRKEQVASQAAHAQTGATSSENSPFSTESVRRNLPRRMFYLNRPDLRARARGQRSAIALFTEATQRNPSDVRDKELLTEVGNTEQSEFKRPGKSAFVRHGATAALDRKKDARQSSEQNEVKEDPEKLKVIAENLHTFAMEEAAKEAAGTIKPLVHQPLVYRPKPKPIVPKLSATRSCEIHAQRVMEHDAKVERNRGHANALDTTMVGTDAEVVDSYVRLELNDSALEQLKNRADPQGVGYLVIEDEDKKLWESYIEDELVNEEDGDEDNDEDDENAESWYGADYPEEEQESDEGHGHDNDDNDDGHSGNSDEDAAFFSEEETLNHPSKTKQHFKKLTKFCEAQRNKSAKNNKSYDEDDDDDEDTDGTEASMDMSEDVWDRD